MVHVPSTNTYTAALAYTGAAGGLDQALKRSQPGGDQDCTHHSLSNLSTVTANAKPGPLQALWVDERALWQPLLCSQGLPEVLGSITTESAMANHARPGLLRVLAEAKISPAPSEALQAQAKFAAAKFAAAPFSTQQCAPVHRRTSMRAQHSSAPSTAPHPAKICIQAIETPNL